MDGKVVNSVDDLITGGQYVAVGTEVGGLKKLAYGATRPNFNNSPKRSRKYVSLRCFRQYLCTLIFIVVLVRLSVFVINNLNPSNPSSVHLSCSL